MALVLKDRVRETSTTTGTGTFTLAGAVAGFQSFSAIGTGNSTYYTIVSTSDWEVGIGTWTSPNQLSRDTVLASTNAGALVTFGSGTKDVFLTFPAEGFASPPAIGGTTPNTITGTAVYGTLQVSAPIGSYTNYVQSSYFLTSSGGATPATAKLGSIIGFSPCGLELNDNNSGNYRLEIDPNSGINGAKYFSDGLSHTFNGMVYSESLELNSGTGYVDIYPAAGSGWQLTLPPSAGSNNQILKTDGSGNLDWMDLGSPPAIGGTTPNTITGTTVSATTQMLLPTITVGNAGIGVLQMIDGLDGYDYLNIYTDDGSGNGYIAKFPYGLSTPTITGLLNLAAASIITASSFEASSGSITLFGTFAGTILQASNATLTLQTFTLPSSTGSANQVLKTDGSGNLDWITQGVQGTAPVTVTTATHTVAATTQWLIANRAGTVTLTLPTASSNTGRSLNVKTITANTVISNASNVVPLTGGAAGTAILAATAGKFATLVSDGTNWIIMAAN